MRIQIFFGPRFTNRFAFAPVRRAIGLRPALATPTGPLPAITARVIAAPDSIAAAVFSSTMRLFSAGVTFHAPAMPIIRIAMTMFACPSIIPVLIESCIKPIGVSI
jgi:hypothetical protein